MTMSHPCPSFMALLEPIKGLMASCSSSLGHTLDLIGMASCPLVLGSAAGHRNVMVV